MDKLTPFMASVKRLVAKNKQRRREAFIKSKNDEKKAVFSLFRPKRNNVYQKNATQKKNNKY